MLNFLSKLIYIKPYTYTKTVSNLSSVKLQHNRFYSSPVPSTQEPKKEGDWKWVPWRKWVSWKKEGARIEIANIPFFSSWLQLLQLLSIASILSILWPNKDWKERKAIVDALGDSGVVNANFISEENYAEQAKHYKNVQKDLLMLSYTGYRVTRPFVKNTSTLKDFILDKASPIPEDWDISEYFKTEISEYFKTEKPNPIRATLENLLQQEKKITLIILSENQVNNLDDKIVDQRIAGNAPINQKREQIRKELQEAKQAVTEINDTSKNGNKIILKEIQKIPESSEGKKQPYYAGTLIDDELLFIEVTPSYKKGKNNLKDDNLRLQIKEPLLTPFMHFFKQIKDAAEDVPPSNPPSPSNSKKPL